VSFEESYSINVRERRRRRMQLLDKMWTGHYDGNLNKKQQIDLFGELALEWTMDGTDVKHLGQKTEGR